jgi:hypothetical protein
VKTLGHEIHAINKTLKTPCPPNLMIDKQQVIEFYELSLMA